MDIKQQPKLKFNGVKIVNVDYSAFKPIDIKDFSITLNIIPKVFYPKDNPLLFNVFMDINISVDDYFEIRVVGMGIFELESSEYDEEIKKQFINRNAPAIMFPYMRSFITTFTSNLGGTTGVPLIIPPQFFKGELEEITEDTFQNEQ